MGREEELHDKGLQNTFNIIIAENFPNLGEKEAHLKIRDKLASKRQDQKRNCPCYTIVKRQNTLTDALRH